ncbi:MAG: hypothetical protein PHV05_11475 [Candidatus Riflebacteria bacterium]|nr:hypothetical protein [Candidatus Riflebacteria bacterium]
MRKYLLVLLLLAAILQSGNLALTFALKVFPVLGKLSGTLKFGVIGFFIGTIYYFSAIINFFIQKKTSEISSNAFLIAGRPFKPDLSLYNPANHVVLSATLVFVSLGAIFASQLPP